MIYGLDAAYAPTTATARILWGRGWRWFGGYIGGPRAAHKWSNADFGRLASVGFAFAPLYVGRNMPWDGRSAFTFEQGLADGDDSNWRAGEAGFNEEQPICLDVEANAGMGNLGQALLDYCDGWCQRTHEAGHKTIVYTSASLLGMLGDHFDFKWGAEWVGNKGFYVTPPSGLYDPSEPPAWDLWQFADNIDSSRYDGNSGRNDFPFAVYTPPS